MGRSTGYTYAKNGTVQQTVTTGYGSDGRINSAGFLHGGSEKQFSYEYMAGTHLLEKLTMRNNMDLTQSYEIQRNLLTGMAYHRGTTLVANRQYSYDTLGRPTARNTSRQGTVNKVHLRFRLSSGILRLRRGCLQRLSRKRTLCQRP